MSVKFPTIEALREGQRRKRVLLVEDSAVYRKAIREALPAGYDVIEASDGMEGLAILQSNSKIDLVFTDVNMPRLDGLQMLEAFKATGLWDPKALPVVMLTSESSKEQVLRGRMLGVAGWLLKPTVAERIRKVCDTFLGRTVL